MLDRAAALFSTRGADLAGYIYGQRAVVEVSAACTAGPAGSAGPDCWQRRAGGRSVMGSSP